MNKIKSDTTGPDHYMFGWPFPENSGTNSACTPRALFIYHTRYQAT